MPITAVAFDLDDTLLDHSGAVVAAAEVFRQTHAIATAPADFLRHWRSLADEAMGCYFAGELGYLEQRRWRMRQLLGAALTDHACDGAFEPFRAAYVAHWAAFADVAGCLDRLQAAGLALAIISNGDPAQQRFKLSRLGLLNRFAAVLCLDGSLAPKPAPDLFHAAARQLGCTATALAMVGDRPDYDAIAARDAGCLGIWLDRQADPAPTPPGCLRISGLAELDSIVGLPAASPGPCALSRPGGG